jgi:hypothetical protein
VGNGASDFGGLDLFLFLTLHANRPLMHTIKLEDDDFEALQLLARQIARSPALRKAFRIERTDVGPTIGPPVMRTRASSNPTRSGRDRESRADLRRLVEAGLLEPGQWLQLRDYTGRPIEGCIAQVGSANRLRYHSRQYSMSHLAARLLQDHGYFSESVRGPALWYTAAGQSVRALWSEYLRFKLNRSRA